MKDYAKIFENVVKFVRKILGINSKYYKIIVQVNVQKL